MDYLDVRQDIRFDNFGYPTLDLYFSLKNTAEITVIDVPLCQGETEYSYKIDEDKFNEVVSTDVLDYFDEYTEGEFGCWIENYRLIRGAK